ncbi:MAG: transcriptional regulator [Terrimesophilobacter sp.]
MSEKEFIRGNDRIDQMLQRPGTAEVVANLEQQADVLDRVHAMSLAMVREAGKHTQAEIARTLNMTQGSVSQMERRDDMLLSTLRNYLTATGAENPRILVTINGQDIALDI